MKLTPQLLHSNIPYYNTPYSPERRLLFAILFRATHDLKSTLPHIRNSAKNFFLSKTTDHFPNFSFLFICQHLNIPPTKFISKLLKKNLL